MSTLLRTGGRVWGEGREGLCDAPPPSTPECVPGASREFSLLKAGWFCLCCPYGSSSEKFRLDTERTVRLGMESGQQLPSFLEKEVSQEPGNERRTEG